MKRAEDFLKLIGAPWVAYHDHSNPQTAASLATIREANANIQEREVCEIYGCNYPDSEFVRDGRNQRASRDLIVQAPRMYQYIASMAETGDTEAKLILHQIHGDAS